MQFPELAPQSFSKPQQAPVAICEEQVPPSGNSVGYLRVVWEGDDIKWHTDSTQFRGVSLFSVTIWVGTAAVTVPTGHAGL